MKKSIATYVTDGYGQVEPNHLSGQRTGQIYAQLAAEGSINVLENGQFVKYDYANNQVNFTGDGEWMLVFNEVKIYHTKETNKDYAMTKDSQIGGLIVPRVLKTNVGDIYTTNFVSGDSIAAGDKLSIKGNGIPTKGEPATEGMIWQVVKVYTLADGQPAVKLMRIQ